jgi:predicted nucleic acid-binding protein
MIIIVADSSALISLAVTDIFRFTKDIEFKIAREVYNELILIKVYKDKDGYNADKIIKNLNNWNIEILNIKDKRKLNALLKDPLVDKGEAESLVLALENAIEDLVTDDIRSIQALNKHSQDKVYINTSAIIPIILYASGKISKKQARQAIVQIFKYRKWNKNLFEEVINRLNNIS